MRELPPLTTKQEEILSLLFKFRFLTTTHIQSFLQHKNPNRSLSWLRDLTSKEYINRIFEPRNFEQNTKPAIYYLGKNGRTYLKQKSFNNDELKKVYKENQRSQKFIDHCLALASICLYFSQNSTTGEVVHFSTKGMLSSFEHFPDPLPDLYIARKTDASTRRYFLDFFDSFIPSFVIRKRVKDYITYFESGVWQDVTNSPLPHVMLIVPSKRTQKHITMYSQKLLEKTYLDISFYISSYEEFENSKKFEWHKIVVD